MGLKDFWSRTTGWLQTHKLSRADDLTPQIDDEGLISQDTEPTRQAADESPQAETQSSEVIVKAVPPADKSASLEKLQAGFDKLIGQLRGINEHLDCQVAQHEDLMGRVEKLPELLENFPAAVENQKRLIEQMLEQLESADAKNQQFIDAVEKIPAETAKQTDALTDIDHQLAAAADTDVQMAEGLNKFNETLEKLNQSTASQTDGILQMSKTFATSDRYLKYIMSRQRRSFMWVFFIALSICVLAILILTGIIIYLKQ